MADFNSYNVALVTLQADSEQPVYLTNHHTTIVLDGKIWVPCPEMDLEDLPDKTGGLDSNEGTIKALRTSASTVLDNIAGGYPYNQIEVTIEEAKLDTDTLALLSSSVHVRGLVYQGMPFISTGFVDLVIKSWKYYTDVVAGVACTEYCYVKHFGDNMCQASVTETPVVADSVDGTDVVLTSVPAGVDFLYNKGYFKYNGTSIKIKYWQSGDTFQTSEPMPSDWVGRSITLVAGCDKTIETCRSIHNNEEHFSGWGYSMIDYNPQTEDGA